MIKQKQENVTKQTKSEAPVLGSNPSRLKSKFIRFKKSEEGVAAIEFGLIGPMFFALIFAIIDVSIYFMLERVTEASSDLISRRIKTHIIPSGVSEGDLRNNICELPNMSMFDCASIQFDVQVIDQFAPPEATPRNPDGSLNSDGFAVNVGGSQQIHIVRIFVPWPSILPWGEMFKIYGSSPDAKVDGERMIVAATAFLKE